MIDFNKGNFLMRQNLRTLMLKLKEYKSFKMKILMGLILIGLFLCGYVFLNEKNLMSNKLVNERIYLHFGVYGENDFYEYSGGDGENHPAGAGFTDLNWKPPKLGKITVGTPYAELDIDNVFYVLGTNFRHYKNGIQIIDVTASLHLEEYTRSYDAYRAYVALMTQLNQKGWQQYFFPSGARIHPDQNLRYIRENLGDIIDPSYILTFDEWQNILNSTYGSLTFDLYKDDLQLGIILKRTIKNIEEDREQYMLKYTFTTQKYALLNLIKNSYKMNQEELEKMAKEEGYRIDEDYVDQDLWRYIK